MTGKHKLLNQEGFSLETRYVVLSFMGRVPTGDSLSSSMGSSRSVPSDGSRSPTKSVGSATNSNGTLSKQALKTLPEINMVDKYHESQLEREHSQTSEHHTEVLREAATDGATKRTTPPKKESGVKTGALSARPSSIPLPMRVVSRSPGKAADKGSRLPVAAARSSMVATTDTALENSGAARVKSERPGIVTAGRGNWNQRATMTLESAAAALGDMHEGSGESKGIPQSRVPYHQRECSDGVAVEIVEKSESESSCTTSENSPSIACSLRSYTSSTSVLDLPSTEIEMLVRRNALPPLALPLKEELTEELHQLEQLMPLPRAMTPQSEVAYYLAQIGDRVQEEYSSQLCETTGRILELPQQQVTYDFYHRIAEELISASSGWTRVVLLLLLSQKLAFAMLSRGERNLSELADYTAHLIEDSTADFIVESGGWNAVREIASTPDTANPMMMSPMFTPKLPGVDEHDHLDSIDEIEDTLSQADSAISTDFTPDTSTALHPQTRDISMDSISSSVWGDAAPPGAATDTGDATGSAPPSPGGGTNTFKGGATSNTLPPPGGDAEVVRDEIRLLRQMSSQLSWEAKEQREANRWRRIQIILISTVTAIVAAYIAYKKLHR